MSAEAKSFLRWWTLHPKRLNVVLDLCLPRLRGVHRRSVRHGGGDISCGVLIPDTPYPRVERLPNLLRAVFQTTSPRTTSPHNVLVFSGEHPPERSEEG